jgi:hypothetical protein
MGVGGPRGQSRRMRKILPSPGFEPRTVQPIDSTYTDYAISLFSYTYRNFKFHTHKTIVPNPVGFQFRLVFRFNSECESASAQESSIETGRTETDLLTTSLSLAEQNQCLQQF